MPGSRMQISSTDEMVKHEAAGEPWAAVWLLLTHCMGTGRNDPRNAAGKDCKGRNKYDAESSFSSGTPVSILLALVCC